MSHVVGLARIGVLFCAVGGATAGFAGPQAIEIVGGEVTIVGSAFWPTGEDSAFASFLMSSQGGSGSGSTGSGLPEFEVSASASFSVALDAPAGPTRSAPAILQITGKKDVVVGCDGCSASLDCSTSQSILVAINEPLCYSFTHFGAPAASFDPVTGSIVEGPCGDTGEGLLLPGTYAIDFTVPENDVLDSTLATWRPDEAYLIDFEEYAEGTPISDQYKAFGVTFEIEGDPKLLPVIATEGAPTVGFAGTSADTPMPSGSGGLTDPLVDGSFTVGNDLRMRFDPPVDDVSFFIADIDSAEVFTATAFVGSTPVATMTRQAGDPGTGNGQSTFFHLAADGITSVLIDVSATPGWALDLLAFTRPCCASADCLGDLNRDTVVDGADLGILLGQWNTPGSGDLDGSGVVDGADLGILLGAWGACP